MLYWSKNIIRYFEHNVSRSAVSDSSSHHLVHFLCTQSFQLIKVSDFRLRNQIQYNYSIHDMSMVTGTEVTKVIYDDLLIMKV